MSTAEKLFLFRSDVQLCFFFVPLLLAGATFLLPKRLKIVVITGFALLVVAGSNLEALIYQTTGSFTNFETIRHTAAWILKSHNLSVITIQTSEMLPIALEIALVVASGFVSSRCMRRQAGWINSCSLLLFGCIATLGLAAGCVSTPVLAWSQPLLETEAQSALQKPDDDPELEEKDVRELLDIYRTSSHYTHSSNTEYSGTAKGYNLILVVLETAPAQILDPAKESLDDLPNLRRLRQHAFVSNRHYTTFPLTNRASFSIFTSLYTRCAAGFCMGDETVELPGLIRSIRRSGYKAGYYGYVWKSGMERDERMLSSLGFDKVTEPTLDSEKDHVGAETFMGPLSYVESRDVESLHSLLRDIREWSSHGQKFAAAFFPELGHDPWREIDHRPGQSSLQTGHALVVHQDAWLGKIVEELRRDGTLDKTIIVVTGDHGLRFLKSPGAGSLTLAVRGKLDDIMVRVPLLIYVPKVLKQTVKIDSPTSHIDISPTILELLGVNWGRELEQGQPIWSPGLAKRRVFLSMDTFGATGYVDAGSEYFSIGTVANTTYHSHELKFDDRDALAIQSKEAVEARVIIARQNQLQDALVRQLLTNSGPRFPIRK